MPLVTDADESEVANNFDGTLLARVTTSSNEDGHDEMWDTMTSAYVEFELYTDDSLDDTFRAGTAHLDLVPSVADLAEVEYSLDESGDLYAHAVNLFANRQAAATLIAEHAGQDILIISHVKFAPPFARTDILAAAVTAILRGFIARDAGLILTDPRDFADSVGRDVVHATLQQCDFRQFSETETWVMQP